MTTTEKIRSVGITTVLGLALILGLVGSVYAAPGGNSDKQMPPTLNFVSGQDTKEPQLRGGEAKSMKPLGSTETIKVAPQNEAAVTGDFTAQAGAVASVDLTGLYNYCYRDRVYVQVKNNTSAVKYIQVRLYSQGYWYEQYVSVPANSYRNVAFYGVQGAYTAYLYVWNGSTYQYDEYRTGTNTCRVAITRVYNSGGWVQLKYENTGTAYATVQSTELAPYPAAGTYTGTHYNYPAPGGAAQYRWFSVGTSPYGIVADITGSSVTPSYFYGDL